MANVTEIDSSGFRYVCEELAKISGKSFEEVLINQIGATLKACIRYTPAASRENIVKRVSKGQNYVKFESGHVVSRWTKDAGQEMFLDTSNWSARKKRDGTPPKWIRGGKTWHQMDSPKRHWSDERWARYQSMKAEAAQQIATANEPKNRKKRIKEALASRGISKHSWLQIAEDLGISAHDVGAAQFVQNAKPSNGQEYKNGIAKKMLSVAAAYIEISNDNPLVVDKLNGASVLTQAIKSRSKAFETDVEKGTFTDLAQRAKRYPGLFTITTAA